MALPRPRSIDTIVDEAIVEAKKHGDHYITTVSPKKELLDTAFDKLKPLLTNALKSPADNKAIIEGTSPLSLNDFVQKIINYSYPTTLTKVLNDNIKGIKQEDADAFIEAVINSIPGGQALEAIKKKAGDKNGFQKIYKESKLAEETILDLAKDRPTTKAARNIQNGIQYIAMNAPKTSPLANPDGKELAAFITKLFDPTDYQTAGAIAKALMSPPITDAIPVIDPTDFKDLTYLRLMATEILEINDQIALIQLQNKLKAEVKNLKDQIPPILNEAKTVTDAITDSLGKLLPDTIVEQLKQSKQAMLDHKNALNELLKEKLDLIIEKINKIESYAKSTDSADEISKEMSDIGLKILEHNKSIADHGKKHAEAIKAPAPDASWINIAAKVNPIALDQEKLENDFLKDTLNVYELLYGVLKSAEGGDANAHAELEKVRASVKNSQKALDDIKNEIDTANALVAGAAKGGTPHPASAEFIKTLENMAARFGQLYQDMGVVSQKKLEQLEMERYCSPTPPTLDNMTAAELKDWANGSTNKSPVTTVTPVLSVKSGIAKAPTQDTDTLGTALGIGGDSKTIEKGPITRDHYVKLYDGSNGTSSVFCEKKDFRNKQKSYELNVYDLPETISDRGLLNQFLTQKMKTLSGHSLSFVDSEGNPIGEAEIKDLIFKKLPAVVTEISLRSFLDRHVRVSGRMDGTLVSKFKEYLSGEDANSPRVQKITFTDLSGALVKDSGVLGWVKGRMGKSKEVTIPSEAMLEQARLFLNTVTASGCESPAFESDNKQLVLAVKIVAEIAGVTVEFAHNSPKPSPEQIDAVRSPKITSNKSSNTYIGGLSSKEAPGKVINIVETEFLPRVKGFKGKGAAGEKYELPDDKPAYSERTFRPGG